MAVTGESTRLRGLVDTRLMCSIYVADSDALFRLGRKGAIKMDLALLLLRLTVGVLLAGHGAQKLFGWFDGHGLRRTASWLASMGFRPA